MTNVIEGENRLLDVSEMARILNVPASWVYSRTRAKEENPIPCVRVGRYVRFDAEKVKVWVMKKYERLNNR